MRRSSIILFTLVLLALYPTLVSAGPTMNDVQQALVNLTPARSVEIMDAFSVGFEQGRLNISDTLHLINRLRDYPGEQVDKEGIVLAIAHALQDDLPAAMLMEKAEEGMARMVPLDVILNGVKGPPRILGLTEREYLLSATKGTLYSKGIFASPPGEKAATESLPLPRFDTLVNEISDALADYVESGQSPMEGPLLYQQVSDRLNDLSSLKAPIIPAGDARLVLERITPADLTSVVLKLFE